LADQPGMGKNYWAALGLSLLVLMGYPTFLKLIYPPQESAPVEVSQIAETQAVESLQREAALGTSATSVASVTPETGGTVSTVQSAAEKSAAQLKQKFINFENRLYVVEFSTLGGAVTKLFFKGEPGKEAITEDFLYNGNVTQQSIFQTRLLHDSIDLAQTNFTFKKLGAHEDVYEFTYEKTGDYRFIKRYLVGSDNPSIHLEIEMTNLSSREKHFPLELNIGMDFNPEHREDERFVLGAVETDKVRTGSLGKIRKKGYAVSEEIKWGGLLKKYFSLLVRPESWETIGFNVVAPSENTMIATLRMKPLSLAPGEVSSQSFVAYAGPQRKGTLKALGFESLASRGFFGIFKTAIFSTLEFFYKYTHNYGWAIILVTLIIKALFTPLTHMSFDNMKKMQAIQPKLKSLQERHKKDPTKLNKEMMGLYKRNKVNPMMGCLPMLLQIPIFIAFYQGLAEAIELKGAPWIWWITDLSQPDRLFTLPFEIPMLGDGLNILPLLMIGSMVWQQKLTPTVGVNPDQAKMMAFMPLIFGVMFYKMPSGLVLYWFVNNLLSIIHQVFVKRIVVVLHHEDRDE